MALRAPNYPLPDNALRARAHGRSSLVIIAVFSIITAAAFVAHSFDNPVSVAVIYLLGVVVIGAAYGRRAGAASGLAASFIYNFFLSEPTLTITYRSPEDYVPFIAFNASALISGSLSGRVFDRARAEQAARARQSLLIKISRTLQEAIELPEIGAALGDLAQALALGGIDTFAIEDGRLLPTRTAGSHQAFAEELVSSDQDVIRRGALVAEKLITPRGVIGVLIRDSARVDDNDERDWATIVPLLTIALERSLLFREHAGREALRQSDAFKTALLSSVSHDIRSPLTAIIASATSLLAYRDNLSRESVEALLKVIEQQAGRLDRYTANLLNLAELASEGDSGTQTVLDLREIAGLAIAGLRGTDRHLIVKQLPEREMLMRGNAAMVEQIFVNLLENAQRYAPAGTTIRIDGHVTGARAAISISDEGPGIAPRHHPKIFDRFYRPEEEGSEGQGLGLAIAQGFAERFGGKVVLESPLADGHGTRFTVSFPLLSAEGTGQ